MALSKGVTEVMERSLENHFCATDKKGKRAVFVYLGF